MEQYIKKIRNNLNLSFDESKSAFELLMNGKASDREIFEFLTFLSVKGECSEEIAGGVYVLRFITFLKIFFVPSSILSCPFALSSIKSSKTSLIFSLSFILRRDFILFVKFFNIYL